MISREKQTLRSQSLAALRAFPGKPAASLAIAARLRDSPAWRVARVVYGFLPLASEPAWLRLGEDGGKTFAFPRIVGDAMLFYVAGEFAPGRLGALEPVGGVFAPAPDLILVPGLAFDRSGHRLGRGGGFYDRWLGEREGVPALGLCFDCQIVDRVPREDHDILVDGWLSESDAWGRV